MDEKTEAKVYYFSTRHLTDKQVAKILIDKCLNKPGVIYQVFLHKNEAEKAELAAAFLQEISYAQMQSLVKGNSHKQNNEGLFLCKWLYKWLVKNASAEKNNSWWSSKKSSVGNKATDTLGFLQFSQLIKETERNWNLSVEPRRLTDAEIDDYRDQPGGGNFDMDIIWELPVNAPGYVVYNRNDVARDGLDQIGTHETILAIKAIAGLWNQKHPNCPIQVGDLSRPGGLDTSQHAGHENGKIFDMRPLRNDNANGPLNYTNGAYSQDRTKEFIRLVRQFHPNVFILFNDPDIAGQGEFTYVRSDTRGIHDDHLHIEFR